MTIKHIRENLEDARKGLPWRVPDDSDVGHIIGSDGSLDENRYTRIHPTMHETKLYSLIEGLIVEIERLQARVNGLLDHHHSVQPRNASNEHWLEHCGDAIGITSSPTVGWEEP